MMDRIRQDLRIALRGFRRTPAFFISAVVILGLGIGMSVAMVTVFRAVLVRRLPVADQDRIVVMWTYKEKGLEAVLGAAQLDGFRRQTKTLSDVAAVAHFPATEIPLIDGTRSIGLNRSLVSGNFFDVLGAHAFLGRLIEPSDDDVGAFQPDGRNASKVMVISYAAWQRVFNGDSAIVGRHIIEPYRRWVYTIIGVAPPGLGYPAGAEYWIPMWGGWTSGPAAIAVGRLKPGSSIASARDEYLSIANRVTPQAKFTGVDAKTFADTVLGDIAPILSMLMAAVGLLLLIACLNVGNLLLLRASGRSREIAVRRALGAAYGDIVRQLVVEAGAIAVAGGALGLLVAELSLRALVVFAPAQLPRLDTVQLSGAPFAEAFGITGFAVLVFGVLPALLAARANLASPLRLDSRSGVETRHRRTIRQALVASQVALAMVMLGGAALLARSLERLQTQSLGFVSDHLSVLSFTYNAMKTDSVSKLIALGEQLLPKVRALPGVTSVTPILVPPLYGQTSWQQRFDREGQTDEEATYNSPVPIESAGPDYFKTFGIPIVKGRAFLDSDRENAPLVAIVSESVARRFWGSDNPIGKRIRVPTGAFAGVSGWITIVGVAPDTHLRSFKETAPTVYLPWHQSYWQPFIAIRSTTSLASLLPAIRRAANEIDPQFELWHGQTMDQLLDEPLAQPRFSTMLMSAFGLVALVLAAIGLYGVMSSLVRDQTREIGIRLALGATPTDVRTEVMRKAGILIGSGVLVGLTAAFAGSRLLATVLFEVRPTDPVALLGATAVLMCAGALAAYLPARRATRIDPVEALRTD